jgi:hypothetical protein
MTAAFGKRGAARDAAAAPQSEPPIRSSLSPLKIASLAIAGGTLLALVSAAGSRAPSGSSSGEAGELPVVRSNLVYTRPSLATATPSYPVISPITLCKGRFDLDHQMRETCVRMQEEARLQVESMSIDDDVKKLCAQRHVHDWSMYATCARLQMAAKLPVSAKPDRPQFDIVRKCETQWPDSYDMQQYCENKQEKARARSHGGWIDHRIAVSCTGKWPSDWDMFMYCVDRETAASTRR